jgi:serine/threonine protein kinase
MDAAEREQKMLEELANFPHPHIVPHLAGWTQNEKFHILYPLAKCNLRDYMQNRKRPSLTAAEVRWFLTQTRGLADALRHLHTLGDPTVDTSSLLAPKEASSAMTTTQLVGVHHDIKPENILVFPSPKGQDTILKIGDFGSGKVGSLPQGLRSHLETGDRGTLTYEGPDKKFNESRGRGIGASRPFDVWALACVFLELLSWLFMDYEEGVDDFASNRPLLPDAPALENDCFWYEPTNGDYVLRPRVEERLTVLENFHCKGAFKDLLVLIRKMFVVDPGIRIPAVVLYGALDAIVKQALHDLEKDGDLYRNFNTPPPKTVFPDARSTGPSRKISARNLRRSDLDPGSPSPIRSSPREDLVESGSGVEATSQGHLLEPSAPESGQVEIVLDDNRVAPTTDDSSSHLGLERSEPAEREGPVANIAAAFQNTASSGAES